VHILLNRPYYGDSYCNGSRCVTCCIAVNPAVPFVEQLRIKQEMVNDELRTKSTILAVSDIDYIAENLKMLDAIAKYN
jgi:ferredoxin